MKEAMSNFKEETIRAYGDDYKTVKTGKGEVDCTRCDANRQHFHCRDFTDKLQKGNCSGVYFVKVQATETTVQTKPQVQLQLELDLTQAILPVFFTVKGLKVQSLDTALKNQSDAYTVSVKALPQETIEVLAEELKAEFIRRNTKVAV